MEELWIWGQEPEWIPWGPLGEAGMRWSRLLSAVRRDWGRPALETTWGYHGSPSPWLCTEVPEVARMAQDSKERAKEEQKIPFTP